jgi:heme-degrading monooxygenase HmoA
MFTRIVEVTTKNGRAKELCRTIQEKVLPILKNQNGFVDEITLVSTNDPNRVVALSFWKTRDDAQHYHNQQFSNITSLIQNHIEGTPEVQTYDLENSTVHRIAAGRAA